jgi:hypothetical protein
MEESGIRPMQRIPIVMLLIGTIVAPFWMAHDARAKSSQSVTEVGAQYEITKRYETSQKSGDGSSGSSRGQDAILERVIAVRDGGLELEYDLPKGATAEDRARNWQFPARVLKPHDGPMQLLNGAELEARVEGWLKAAGWTREVCGRWIFTWTAFRIDCDPQSVLQTLEAYDLRSAALQDGAVYQDAQGLAPATLARAATGPKGATFTVTLEIDPDAVRRVRAESDVMVGEIMRKPVTFEAALLQQADVRVSGTITVTLEADSAGQLRRRTRVTNTVTTDPDGKSEKETATETVERRLVRRP